jgi:hypothetical protein
MSEFLDARIGVEGQESVAAREQLLDISLFACRAIAQGFENSFDLVRRGRADALFPQLGHFGTLDAEGRSAASEHQQVLHLQRRCQEGRQPLSRGSNGRVVVVVARCQPVLLPFSGSRKAKLQGAVGGTRGRYALWTRHDSPSTRRAENCGSSRNLPPVTSTGAGHSERATVCAQGQTVIGRILAGNETRTQEYILRQTANHAAHGVAPRRVKR